MTIQTLGAAAIVSILGLGQALAGTAETMEQNCLARLNLPPKACACVGNRAEIELSPGQQALVIAMITQDQAASDRLRGELSVAEITRAASWMTRTPAHCAAQAQ